MPRIRRLLITLALAALAALPASATAALVVPDGGARISGGTYQREMDTAKAAGLPWVSVGASWASLQPVAGGALGPDGPGGGAWRTLEGQVTYGHSIGLRVFVQFTGAPAWANGGSADSSTPPTAEGRAAYAAFLQEVATRLGPYIDAYSAWNEVNQPEYWSSPDPAGFAALQRAVYPAFKAGDPTGIVVSGTIYSKGGTFDFMRAAFAAGLRGSYDVLGWMLFSSVQPEEPPPPGRGSPQPTLPSVLDLQAFLAANDPGRPIWIVEYGYSTCQVGDNGFVCVSQATQADYLARAYTYMRRYLNVDRMFWFSLKDLGTGPGREANYGLVRNDFAAKPSFVAMQSLRVNVADGGGAVTTPRATTSTPAPALPRAAARPPDPAALVTRTGKRVALGRPVIRLKRGVFTLTLTVTVKGGRTRLAVQGYRAKRWRPIAATRLSRTARITVRFRDRGYLGIRIRSTVPGTNRWGVSRVIRAPRVAAKR